MIASDTVISAPQEGDTSTAISNGIPRNIVVDTTMNLDAVLWVVCDSVCCDSVVVPIEFYSTKTIGGDEVLRECIMIANETDATIVVPSDRILHDVVMIAMWEE